MPEEAGGDTSDTSVNTIVAGSGGGFVGGNSQSNQNSGGKQNEGGQGLNQGSFGIGGDSYQDQNSSGAGGGGFYGGGSGTNLSAGGGGSGYIGNDMLGTKHMAGFNVEESSDLKTKTINLTNRQTQVSNVAETDKAKIGDGYAKIVNLN